MLNIGQVKYDVLEPIHRSVNSALNPKVVCAQFQARPYAEITTLVDYQLHQSHLDIALQLRETPQSHHHIVIAKLGLDSIVQSFGPELISPVLTGLQLDAQLQYLSD